MHSLAKTGLNPIHEYPLGMYPNTGKPERHQAHYYSGGGEGGGGGGGGLVVMDK